MIRIRFPPARPQLSLAMSVASFLENITPKQALFASFGVFSVYRLIRALQYWQWKKRNLVEAYGEWALVTGASAGIGKECALYLASRGFSVVLVARRADQLKLVEDAVKVRYKVNSRIVTADLSTAEGAAAVADAVKDLEIGLLVNNAGVGYAGAFVEQDNKKLQDLIQLNCNSVITLTSLLLPPMQKRRRGGVVFISSVAALQPLPLHAVYAASKSFISSFGVGLWDELKGTGIDVLVSEPGSVRTDFSAGSGTDVGPSRGASPIAVAEETVNALGFYATLTPASVFSYWRSLLASLLPRSWIAPLARRRQQRLLSAETKKSQ